MQTGIQIVRFLKWAECLHQTAWMLQREKLPNCFYLAIRRTKFFLADSLSAITWLCMHRCIGCSHNIDLCLARWSHPRISRRNLLLGVCDGINRIYSFVFVWSLPVEPCHTTLLLNPATLLSNNEGGVLSVHWRVLILDSLEGCFSTASMLPNHQNTSF